MTLLEPADKLIPRLTELVEECDRLLAKQAMSADAHVGWKAACNNIRSAMVLFRQAYDFDRLPQVWIVAGELVTNAIYTLFWYASHHDTEATRLVVLHALYREAAREMNGILGAVVFGALDARLVK